MVTKLQEAEQSGDELYFDFALEQAEGLCGIAFVTAQTYITGTIADVKRLALADTKFKKDQLLKEFNDNLPGLTPTKLEFCDAMANYFKHHEEWQRWAGAGQKQKTVTMLQAAGLNEADNYPCVKAIHILLPENEWNLMPLLKLLSSWRESIIEAYKQK